MNRRRFLSTLGAAAGAGTLALGSGAFTSVEAERTVAVDVADDDRAFLRLEPIVDDGVDGDGDGEADPTGRSFTNGETVGFELPGDEDGENPDAAGVGIDSVYEFGDLLMVVNQGTQPVTVHSTYDGSALADLALLGTDGVLRDDPPTLDVGESLDAGLLVDTHGSDVGSFDETLTVVAERVGGNQD